MAGTRSAPHSNDRSHKTDESEEDLKSRDEGQLRTTFEMVSSESKDLLGMMVRVTFYNTPFQMQSIPLVAKVGEQYLVHLTPGLGEGIWTGLLKEVSNEGDIITIGYHESALLKVGSHIKTVQSNELSPSP